MFDPQLFLGFCINSYFSKLLNAIEPKKIELFIEKIVSNASFAAFSIQTDSNIYLQEVSYQNAAYLGKFAGEINSIENLFLLENNIRTLLMKLVPEYPPEDIRLELIPIFVESHEG